MLQGSARAAAAPSTIRPEMPTQHSTPRHGVRGGAPQHSPCAWRRAVPLIRSAFPGETTGSAVVRAVLRCLQLCAATASIGIHLERLRRVAAWPPRMAWPPPAPTHLLLPLPMLGPAITAHPRYVAVIGNSVVRCNGNSRPFCPFSLVLLFFIFFCVTASRDDGIETETRFCFATFSLESFFSDFFFISFFPRLRLFANE